MSRRLLVLPFLAAGVVALAALLDPLGASVRPALRTVRTVSVTLRCETRDGWVSDSSVHAAPGDTIAWELTPESDVTDFKIKKKRVFGRWLFRTDEVVGAPGRPARGTDMKPGAEGTYSYKVEGTCQGGPKAVIDPDIIIDLDA